MFFLELAKIQAVWENSTEGLWNADHHQTLF